MEKLKDQKEIKVDETRVGLGLAKSMWQILPLAAAQAGLAGISLQQSIRMEKQQHVPLCPATAQCAESMWSLGQDQHSSGGEHSPRQQECFPWQGDGSDAASWNTGHPWKGQRGGKHGEGWAAMVGESH